MGPCVCGAFTLRDSYCPREVAFPSTDFDRNLTAIGCLSLSLCVPLRELEPDKSAYWSLPVPHCPSLSVKENVYESEGRRFESCRARSPWEVWLADPSQGNPVPATRVHPFARTCVTVLAEHASGVRRGNLLSSPDRQGVPLQLVDVVKGIARVAVEARLYILARLGPEGPFVPNDLDALNPLSVVLEIDVLDKEEATHHPLEADLSLHVPGHLPCANQPVQVLEVRVWLRRLLVSLSVVSVIHHG